MSAAPSSSATPELTSSPHPGGRAEAVGPEARPGAAKARGKERAAATRPQPLIGTPVCFHVFPSTQHPSRPNEGANSQHFLTSDRDDEANVTNV